MCGLTGFWDSFPQHTEQNLETFIRAMMQPLQKRGPDGEGAWIDPRAGLALGHRRLSIQDLSLAGAQPMHSARGRWVLVYNGEIYNAPQLRRKLQAEGVICKSTCDTEVLLYAWEVWGPERTCSQLIGMFAFAFWDRYEEKMYLVRDRLGVKPLYGALLEKTFLFGSTLSSLMEHPHWKGKISLKALESFIRFQYVPKTQCIFSNAFKIKAAHITVVTKNNSTFSFSSAPYWSPPKPSKIYYKTHPDVLKERLKEHLKEAVSCRLIADVPVGCFLSGGIDSSLVAALMQELSPGPIDTFSIGFEEAEKDEAPYAKAVAQHLGTRHHTLYLSAKEMGSLALQLPEIYDEPFADSSQLPSFFLSQWAKKTVSVALSGDGGDEIFAGYPRYALVYSLWKKVRMVPYPLRVLLSFFLRHLSRHFIPTEQEKKEKIIRMVLSKKILEFYQVVLQQWTNSSQITNLDPQEKSHTWPYEEEPFAYDPVLCFQQIDLMGYLQDDILVKMDRASMAASLEVREPLLDHRLIDFAWHLPLSLRMNGSKQKWLLRQVLYDYVPPALIDRPKKGFSISLKKLLYGPLLERVSHHLSPQALRSHGLFHREFCEKIQFFQKTGNNLPSLWSALMFQLWFEKYRSKISL